MRPLNRLQIAWRVAQDIGDGMVVNLGMGMPVAVADYLRPEADVFIHSENGVIGAGPLAAREHIDTDLVDAGSRRITLRPGAAIVDSSWSFAAIRGGHIDVAILGAFEVAANGDLANWDMRLPNKGPLVGGAMDLASCARGLGDHGPRHAHGRATIARKVHVAPHSRALRQARLYRSRRRRHHAGRDGCARDA
jgi:3-oxoadipate CoA-transferase beta subunit